jgi:hypothetical protein
LTTSSSSPQHKGLVASLQEPGFDLKPLYAHAGGNKATIALTVELHGALKHGLED